MAEEKKQEKKASILGHKSVPIVAFVVLVLGIVGMFLFSGKDISIEQVIAIMVAVAGVLGLGVHALRNGTGGGGGALAGGVVLLLAASLFATGCSGRQVDQHSCSQAIIECAGAVISACMPDESQGTFVVPELLSPTEQEEALRVDDE